MGNLLFTPARDPEPNKQDRERPRGIPPAGAESGEVTDENLEPITIRAVTTSRTLSITAPEDADDEDETFTGVLNTTNWSTVTNPLSSVVTPGTRESVQVTVKDDEGKTVGLSGSPKPVKDGWPVTVTATRLG